MIFMNLAEGISIWYSRGRHCYWPCNLMQGLEIDLLQPWKEGFHGHSSNNLGCSMSSTYEVVRRHVPSFLLQVLPFHLWAWEDTLWCTNGILHLPLMGSHVSAYSLLCHCFSYLPTSWHSAVPTGCFMRLINLIWFLNFLAHIYLYYFMFLQLSSIWVLPFAYAFLATYGFSLCEYLICGSTAKGWWNLQRIKFIHRTTSYLFGFIDTMKKQLGLSQTNFVITNKVVTEDVQKRYEQEIIEFGGSSIMLTMLATVALLNLVGLVGGIKRIMMDLNLEFSSSQLMMQITLSSLVVMISLPVYEALFIRSDKGCIPSSVMLKSIVLASLACCLAPFIC